MKSFLTSRTSSWQEDLFRISSFLKHSSGVWWHKLDNGDYEFFYGSTESDYREQTSLLHFRNSKIGDIQLKQQMDWEEIHDTNIELPTDRMTIFTEDGEFLEKIILEDNSEQAKQVTNPNNNLSSDMDITDEANAEIVILESQAENTEPSKQIQLLPTFRTNLAAAVYCAIGESPLLHKLDELRYQMKNTPNPSITTHTTYKKTILSLTAQLKAELKRKMNKLANLNGQSKWITAAYHQMIQNTASV